VNQLDNKGYSALYATCQHLFIEKFSHLFIGACTNVFH
jgi:hypothetical protein